jgi:hypothetical protein
LEPVRDLPDSHRAKAGFFYESITLLSWTQSVRYLSSAFSLIGNALTKRGFGFDLRALHHVCHSCGLVIRTGHSPRLRLARLVILDRIFDRARSTS